MFRKALAEFLTGEPITVAELARAAGVPVKEVALDLTHLARSLKRTDRRLVVTPATCRKCAFAFGEDKLTRPGKCPMCKGTWITEPRVAVRQRP